MFSQNMLAKTCLMYYIHWRYGHSIITTRHSVNKNNISKHKIGRTNWIGGVIYHLFPVQFLFLFIFFISRDAFSLHFELLSHLFHSTFITACFMVIQEKVIGEQWESRQHFTMHAYGLCDIRDDKKQYVEYGKSKINVKIII